MVGNTICSLGAAWQVVQSKEVVIHFLVVSCKELVLDGRLYHVKN